MLQFTFFLAFGAASPFLSLYFKDALVTGDGRPATYLIGFVFFVQSAAGVVAAPLAGYLADRYRIQSGLLTWSAVAIAVSVLVMAIPGFAGALMGSAGLPLATTAVVIFAAAALNGLFQRPIVPLIDAETLRFLRDTRGETIGYGKIRMLGSAGWVISASLMGGLLSVTGRLSDALVASAIGFFVLAAIAAARVPARIEPIRIPWEHLARDRMFLLFLGFVFLNSLGFTSSITFGAYFMDDAHAGLLVIGLAFGLSAAPEVPLMWASSRLLIRWGNRWMIVVGAFLQALRLGLFVLIADSTSPWVFVLVNLLQGAGYALIFVGMINLVDRLSHKDMRTTYLSIFSICGGIATAAGGPFSSVIIANLGSAWLMAIDGMILLGSALYFLAFVRGHGPAGGSRPPGKIGSGGGRASFPVAPAPPT